VALVTLVYLGTDFHETPLEALERFERVADEVVSSLETPSEQLAGVVVLATCNRFEIYFETESFHESMDYVTRMLAEKLQVDADYVSSSLRVLYGDGVPAHLFSVASGLESMIVGEEEIAGQVKRSLARAHRLQRTSKSLNQLFQTAAKVAKEVTTQTGLGASGRSVITTALDCAAEEIDGLTGKTALLIGTGAYSRVVVAALQREGIATTYVYSKSGRAEKFAGSHGSIPVAAGELVDVMASVDLVVSSSGTAGFAVDCDLALKTKQMRVKPQPLVFVDVSLSRDIEPGVGEIAGFSVVDLEVVRDRAPHEHVDSLISAQAIIEKEVRDFTADLASRSIDPVVTALRAHVALWVDEEVESVRRKSGDGAAGDVERSLRKVTNAILHAPSVKAKELAMQGNRDDYIRAVQLLFNVEMNDHA